MNKKNPQTHKQAYMKGYNKCEKKWETRLNQIVTDSYTKGVAHGVKQTLKKYKEASLVERIFG